MWKNGLLCANYVGRKGPVWGRFGVVLGHFCCFLGPQVPIGVDPAWECPEMRFKGVLGKEVGGKLRARRFAQGSTTPFR